MPRLRTRVTPTDQVPRITSDREEIIRQDGKTYVARRIYTADEWRREQGAQPPPRPRGRW